MLTVEQIAHREYLKSATWKDIRNQVIERDKDICCHCRNKGYDVHHKTYKNWGNEKLDDLITLCRACHEQWHASQKGTRKSKSIGNRAILRYLTKHQKQLIMGKFSLNELELEKSIYSNPNKDVLNFAIELLGCYQWYIQASFKNPVSKESKKRFNWVNSISNKEGHYQKTSKDRF